MATPQCVQSATLADVSVLPHQARDILLLKPYKRIPGILLAVTGATLAAGLFQLDQTQGVKVLGSLPQGLPSFTLPWISLADLQTIVIGGSTVALVSFADTSVLSRIYSVKTKTYVDSNQEILSKSLVDSKRMHRLS